MASIILPLPLKVAFLQGGAVKGEMSLGLGLIVGGWFFVL